jgi:hypothetical protein
LALLGGGGGGGLRVPVLIVALLKLSKLVAGLALLSAHSGLPLLELSSSRSAKVQSRWLVLMRLTGRSCPRRTPRLERFWLWLLGVLEPDGRPVARSWFTFDPPWKESTRPTDCMKCESGRAGAADSPPLCRRDELLRMGLRTGWKSCSGSSTS